MHELNDKHALDRPPDGSQVACVTGARDTGYPGTSGLHAHSVKVSRGEHKQLCHPPWLINNAADARDVLQCLLEQHQVHHCICLVVFSQLLLKHLLQGIMAWHWRIQRGVISTGLQEGKCQRVT